MSAVATAPTIWERAADTFNPPAPRYRWVCDLEDCDGTPHAGWDYKHARTKQRPPTGDWTIWLIVTGRGWGKGRTASEAFTDLIAAHPRDVDGKRTEWLIVGETFADARAICVEGPSGILHALAARGIAYEYNKSKWNIVWRTGQIIHLSGAEDADVGRGFNLSGAWLDEMAKWPKPAETWAEGLAPALRIGTPKTIISTTPRPIPVLQEMAARTDGSAVVTRGSTYENVRNLSAAAVAELRRRYEGTRIGRQELEGEFVEDVEGALWTVELVAGHRWPYDPMPLFDRVVVAVDPNVSEGNDECGIVVAGRETVAWGPRAGVLEDASTPDGPRGWAKRVVAAYHDWQADEIIAEKNNGGDLVKINIHVVDPMVPVRLVNASPNKQTRAQPVATLTEAGGWGFYGIFPKLEDQLTTWVPGQKSPDRLDAMVWACHALLLDEGKRRKRRRLYFDGDAA